MDSESQWTKDLTVVVTGATGFFGTNLVKLLSDMPNVKEIRPHARHAPRKHYSMFSRDEEGSVKWVGLGQNRNLSTQHFEPVSDEEKILIGHDPDENIFYNNPKIKRFYASDICDYEFVRNMMKGVDIVFHACGDTRWWDHINEYQRRTNVDGTLTVFQAADRESVRVFVHTSTVDVMGATHSGQPLCESNYDDIIISEKLHRPNEFLGIGYNYADTKAEAEMVLRKEQAGTSFSSAKTKLIIIRPGAMIGARDVTMKYGRIFNQLYNGEIFCWPEGSISVCDVTRVAHAHVKAALIALEVRDVKCETFICAGPSYTYEELFEAMRMRLHEGRRPPKPNGVCGVFQTMPASLAVAYGHVCQWWSTWISGKEPEVNPGMAWYLSTKVAYCSHKAESAFGYPLVLPESKASFLAHVVDEAYQWYAKRGWI
jgi:dihydroflavonol-4-reductase